jgi:hypothetical protein
MNHGTWNAIENKASHTTQHPERVSPGKPAGILYIIYNQRCCWMRPPAMAFRPITILLYVDVSCESATD